MAQVSRRAVLGGGLAALVLAGCGGKTEWLRQTEAGYDLPKPKRTSITVKATSLHTRTPSNRATEAITIWSESGDVAGPMPSIAVSDVLTGRKLWTWRYDGDSTARFGLPTDTRFSSFTSYTQGPKPLLLGVTSVIPCLDRRECPADDKVSHGADVLACDGRTGAKKWMARVVPSVGTSNPQDLARWKSASATVLGGTADAVVVEVRFKTNKFRTIALDADTGRTLWSKDGVRPAMYSDSCVLGTVSNSSNPRTTRFCVLDIRTGKEVEIRGMPTTGLAESAQAVDDYVSQYLHDDLFVIRAPDRNVVGVDLRRRRVVEGPLGCDVAGRLPDGKLMFARLQEEEAANGTHTSWLHTQVEGEPLPAAVQYGETDSVTRKLRLISDGVIWTDTGAVDRAGRALAPPIRGLQFVTKTLAVSKDEVFRISVTH